jgi:hypothetical protein
MDKKNKKGRTRLTSHPGLEKTPSNPFQTKYLKNSPASKTSYISALRPPVISPSPMSTIHIQCMSGQGRKLGIRRPGRRVSFADFFDFEVG